MTLIHKTLSAETKVLDEEQGIVESFVNTMAVKDYDGEVIKSGAFDRHVTAGRKLPKVAWFHQQDVPVGKCLETSQAGTRQRVVTQFNMRTQRGREAFYDVSGGYVDEWSVGFYALDDEIVTFEGKATRQVNDLDWVEYSPVMRGASPGTGTGYVKAQKLSEAADSPDDDETQPAGGVSVGRDGTHAPFTGTHSHAHAAGGDQGGDAQHTHSHSHGGDAAHGHDHRGKAAGHPEVKATWTTAEQNDFPDSSFAYIAPGGSKDDDGKTTPRSLRKLPYRDASGAVDGPHLRNALARLSQSDIPEDEQGAIKKKLEAALAKLNGDGKGRHWAYDRGRQQVFIRGGPALDTKDAPEGSYEDLIQDIQRVLADRFATPFDGDCSVSVFCTFPGFVIVAVSTWSGRYTGLPGDGTSYYRLPYALDPAGEPVLGTPEPVEMTFVPAGQSVQAENAQDQTALARPAAATPPRAAATDIERARLRLLGVRLAAAGVTAKAGARTSAADMTTLAALHQSNHDQHENLMQLGVACGAGSQQTEGTTSAQ